MITAVDTNVLLDIFTADRTFGRLSAEALRRCLGQGAVGACEVVWTETGTAFPDNERFVEAMHTLGIEFFPIAKETALLAAKAWRRYRHKGGKRGRVVADFLIGSHAVTQCDQLLTRDRGFYRTGFDRLRIVDPAVLP
ncbi:MAG: type II toxin-antitoxin system VapC family toxin [Nitrospirota bacterium]